ncbi:MAG TPA: hypothetical protein PLV64_24475, partial [Anaerolineales bacterium]|nr:hypothetical protein [Anaerolineales bacterium]
MNQTYNVYCDESCHLENDHISVMVLGAVWCPLAETQKVAIDIRNIKAAHGLSTSFEIKWTKVSKGQIDFYLNLIQYFFDNPN